MIYVYAITEPRSTVPAGVEGLAGAPLELVTSSGVQGVCSSYNGEAVAPDPEALWTHDAVVDHLLAAGPVLPLRFGSTTAAEPALRSLLDRQAERYLGLLDRVRDRAELAVRVALPDSGDAVADPADGALWLHRRLATERERAGAAERIFEPLARLAAATADAGRSEGPVLSASYLVPTAKIARFAAEVERLQERHPDLALTCTGPWAPYSFVGEDAA